MNRFSLNYLGLFLLLISVLAFLNIIYSYYFNLYLNINVYFYTLLISISLGALFLLKKKNDTKISIYVKILTVIIGYLILPLIISIPYYLSIYNISFLNCFFESVSGFTSTGFTIFDNIRHIDESLILWRSSSQWIGGIYFLFSIIVLIDIFDDNLKKSLTNFISFNSTETFKQSLKILLLYSALTLFLFLSLKLINIRTFDSFNLSMTIISSGGFIPVNNIELIVNSDIKKIIFSILMLFSYFSLFLTYNFFYIKNRNINFFGEDIYLFIYLIFLITIFFVFFNFNYNFTSIFFSISSSISNIGISFNDTSNNLFFLFLILVIVGGSFFSTSSGIRFIKLYALIKFSINELLSHVRPNNIYINRLNLLNTNIQKNDLYKYFLSVIVFIISLFVISSLLAIFDFNFSEAFKIGILTIMNTVNSSMYGLGDFSFLEINPLSKFILIFFMIIGRIELITLLIISKKFLFKN